MLIVDKKKKKIEKQILNDSIDGAYLRDLNFRKDQIEIEGSVKSLSPSIRVDELLLDNDSRNMHR